MRLKGSNPVYGRFNGNEYHKTAVLIDFTVYQGKRGSKSCNIHRSHMKICLAAPKN